MWTFWVFVALFAAVVYSDITYIEVRLPLEGDRSPPGSPWPLPQKYAPTKTLVEVNPETFEIRSNAISCDIIDKAISRYRKLLFPVNETTPGCTLTKLTALTIEVEDFENKEKHCAYPQHKSDEKYHLEVSEKGSAILQSKTVWGALRGLETFSQLVYHDEKRKSYFINATVIDDWPRFSFRGILLDTARHFQPMKVLKQNLEAMSYSKFNVFHWHLVDDQSWPYEMKVFPNLTKAAYHPKLVYTQSDVRDIIEYARQRGIRVIPEIDTPGHTQAIGSIFPELLTPCYGANGKGSAQYPKFASHEMLNPMQSYTYDVMNDIFNETTKTFPDEYIHLGMDEVYYSCWQSSPDIKNFMAKNDLKNVSQVEQYYVRKTLENVRKLGAKYMIWQDPIDNGVKAAPDTLVGVWKDIYLDQKLDPWQSYMSKIVKHGYEIVLSAPWYLNYISYGEDWKKYYNIDPRSFPATDKEKDLLVGGEACMWGEYVDGTNMISRLWPRASAVGERLWSDASVMDVESAKFRLDELRCRMVRRGIPAAPILNGYCGGYDWDA